MGKRVCKALSLQWRVPEVAHTTRFIHEALPHRKGGAVRVAHPTLGTQQPRSLQALNVDSDGDTDGTHLSGSRGQGGVSMECERLEIISACQSAKVWLAQVVPPPPVSGKVAQEQRKRNFHQSRETAVVVEHDAWRKALARP